MAARLPTIPNRLVTTEAPRSRVSGDVVGAPFTDLGRALGTLGEGVEAVGVRVAEEEARKAVTLDNDGKPQFEAMPALTGRAGEAYNKVGYQKWATMMADKVDKDLFAARQKNRGNPEAFEIEAKAYVDKLIENEPDEKLKDIIRQQGQSVATQHYRGLATEKQNLDIQSTKASLLQRADILENKMAALARQGGVDTPEYKAAQADYRAIEGMLTGNPLYAYPADVATNVRLKMEARHTVQAAIGTMDGIFTKKGRDAARRYLEGVAWDPRLNLDEKDRTQLVSQGLARLEGLTAEDAAGLQGFRQEVDQFTQNMKKGFEFNAQQYEELLQRAVRFGDVKTAGSLRGALVENTTLRQVRSLPDAAKAQYVRDLNVGLNLSTSQRDIKGKIEQAATAAGIDPSVAVMVAFRESSLDPNAVPKRKQADGSEVPASSARGLFQLDKVQRERHGVTDDAGVDEQIRGGLASLKARIDDMRTRLGRDPNASEIYLAHFQGAAGAETLLKATPDADLKGTLDSVLPTWRSKDGKTWGDAVLSANPWMKAYPTVGAFRERITQMVGDAAQRADATQPQNNYIAAARANVAGVLTAEMSQGVDKMVDGFIEATKKRNAVNADDLNTLVEWVQITGRFDAGRKLADHLINYETGRLVTSIPEPQRAELLRKLRDKAETQGETAAERAGREMIENQIKVGTEELKKNPHMEAQRQGIVQAAPPFLDVTNPDALAAAMPQRVQTARAIRNHNPSNGPVQALDEDEINRLGPALTHGDPQKAAAILSTLQRTTDPEMFAQTLAIPAMKSAIDGMIRSGDTTRMGAAFSALDVVYRTNRQQFEATYGKDMFSRLAVWQENLSYKTPDQIAEQFRKTDDPAVRNAREEVRKKYEEEAKNLSTNTLLGEFGTKVLGVNVWSASPSNDPVQMQVFRGEFSALYAELRADGVSQENAIKRTTEWLGRVWGVSSANGNRLMRRPPESWAPAVNGSHAWMHAEIKKEIERVTGKPEMEGPFKTVVGFADMKFNWDYSLVSDSQTEAEIARLRAWQAANPGKEVPNEVWPSYGIVVFDANQRTLDLWQSKEDAVKEGPFPMGADAFSTKPARAPRFRWTGDALRESRKTFLDQRRYSEPAAVDLTMAMR